MIAIRLNDVRNGTNTIDDVLLRYQAAWDKKGMIDPATGLFKDMLVSKQGCTVSTSDPASTAWGAAFMNSWNSTLVRSCYERQALGYLTTIDNKTELHPPLVGNAYRVLVKEGKNTSPANVLNEAPKRATTEYAHKASKQSPKRPLSMLTKPIFGCVLT